MGSWQTPLENIASGLMTSDYNGADEDFSQFSKQKLPQVFRRTLACLPDDRWKLPSDNLKDLLVSTISDCETEIWSLWDNASECEDVRVTENASEISGISRQIEKDTGTQTPTATFPLLDRQNEVSSLPRSRIGLMDPPVLPTTTGPMPVAPTSLSYLGIPDATPFEIPTSGRSSSSTLHPVFGQFENVSSFAKRGHSPQDSGYHTAPAYHDPYCDGCLQCPIPVMGGNPNSFELGETIFLAHPEAPEGVNGPASSAFVSQTRKSRESSVERIISGDVYQHLDWNMWNPLTDDTWFE
jgi:hypothetical protein